MKLVDILFVLTAATTTSAILIPTNNDRSTHTSGTSSQVSSPTNEPSPGTSNEYQEEPVDLSLSGRIRQQPMDQPGLNTPTQGQRPTATITGPSTFKQGRKRIMDVIDLLISRQNQQRPIDQAPKRDRKQPIDQPIPSTSRQDQQQPMGQGESANTVTNQIAVLGPRYQRSFNRIKKRLVESKKIAKEKREEYCKHADLKFSQQLALARGEEISEPRHNPDTENQLKQEYEKASRRVYAIRHGLKVFMEKHGLEFEEPGSD
ncbi:hypothetical protein BDEG_27486 [Batrachochytrium dendrobatidis JEL423]|uniref:Uncharacterized protein n=1 Tax=Batrachochytrium dendrobatidis (strain JEL423) TaxID=403673 RepID=A0A177WWG4_BATDL|nr:hypothetical protein BDEG_27486 [Batrachochytrium dendrobatidis JEL423]